MRAPIARLATAAALLVALASAALLARPPVRPKATTRPAPVVRPAPSHAEASTVGTIDPTARRLDQRVAGLSFDELVAGMQRFAQPGEDPERNAWLWRATGLLLQHPELCEPLLAIFEREAKNPAVRALIMDLLASSGSSAAQETMRRILASRTIVDDEERVALVQRFSFVERPDVESLDFLLDRLSHATPGLRSHGATAYALGAAAAALSHEDVTAAEVYGDALVDALAVAATPTEREPLLRALGNAGMPAAVPAILACAGDPDASVRAAAAAALRKTPGQGATRTLLVLAGDPEARVQAEALRSLAGQPLSEDVLVSLAGLVQAGRISRDADPMLLTLLDRVRKGPAARAILEAIRDRPGQSGALVARVTALLG